MPKIFEVVLHVPGTDENGKPTTDTLNAVIAATAPQCRLFSVKEITTEPVILPQPQRDTPRYAGGKRNKGITALDLLMRVVRADLNGGATYMQIADAFVSHDPPFAATTARPVITRAEKEKKIVNVGNGRYKAT